LIVRRALAALPFGRDPVVRRYVNTSRYELEVLRAVIGLVAVPVVHMLVTSQRTTNDRFHDEAMLVIHPAANGHAHIAFLIDAAHACTSFASRVSAGR
jgi:hypothetical protein